MCDVWCLGGAVKESGERRSLTKMLHTVPKTATTKSTLNCMYLKAAGSCICSVNGQFSRHIDFSNAAVKNYWKWSQWRPLSGIVLFLDKILYTYLWISNGALTAFYLLWPSGWWPVIRTWECYHIVYHSIVSFIEKTTSMLWCACCCAGSPRSWVYWTHA